MNTAQVISESNFNPDKPERIDITFQSPVSLLDLNAVFDHTILLDRLYAALIWPP